MSELPLVSVITPCYNAEAFLDRYFQSVLSQSYPNIELIFVNDGSTDRSEEIALSYRERLEARGIRYLYIAQENKGVSEAVNAGLRRFSGDYLTWPDSDDWMTPDCIAKKVEYLEAHPEKDIVQCQTNVVNEDAPDRVVGIMRRLDTGRGDVFDDLIFGRDIYYAPVGWMVRSSAFLSANPSRQIRDAYHVGQNWQMLLPVAYTCACGFIPEPLAYYLVRKGSHSRRETDYASKVNKTVRQEVSLKKILSEIDMPEEERQAYFERLEIGGAKSRLRLAMRYHRREDLKKEYTQLREKNACSRTDTLRCLRGSVPLLDAICTPVLRLWMRLHRSD